MRARLKTKEDTVTRVTRVRVIRNIRLDSPPTHKLVITAATTVTKVATSASSFKGKDSFT